MGVWGVSMRQTQLRLVSNYLEPGVRSSAASTSVSWLIDVLELRSGLNCRVRTGCWVLALTHQRVRRFLGTRRIRCSWDVCVLIASNGYKHGCDGCDVLSLRIDGDTSLPITMVDYASLSTKYLEPQTLVTLVAFATSSFTNVLEIPWNMWKALTRLWMRILQHFAEQ